MKLSGITGGFLFFTEIVYNIVGSLDKQMRRILS
jgi:hypothetical protein